MNKQLLDACTRCLELGSYSDFFGTEISILVILQMWFLAKLTNQKLKEKFLMNALIFIKIRTF